MENRINKIKVEAEKNYDVVLTKSPKENDEKMLSFAMGNEYSIKTEAEQLIDNLRIAKREAEQTMDAICLDGSLRCVSSEGIIQNTGRIDSLVSSLKTKIKARKVYKELLNK